MEKYGKEVLEDLMERLLERIQKESWEPFSFAKHHVYYSEYDKEITLHFEKEDWGFRFAIYTTDVTEDWIEHMRMEVDVYEMEEKGELLYVSYGKIVTEPKILEKTYQLVKEEIERTFDDNSELRMKYIFDKKKMLKSSVQLKSALEEIREDEEK